jgi:disulfide bond formation protein DsbB
VSRTEVIDFVETALAALAIVLQVALALVLVLALAALVVPRARSALVALRDLVFGTSVWPAAVIAVVAVSGSLFFSEYADFIPCPLCWYQRIAMYPLALILVIAAVRRDHGAAFVYGLPLAVIGALFSTYHVYVEINPDAEAGFCQAGGVSCATKWIDVLGYVTIPVLALTAFVSIAVLLVSARSSARASAALAEPG